MANTSNRNYPRPDNTRTIAEEFPVSDQALVAIDSDIATLFAGLLLKADADHVHTIANITGLQTALDGKASSSHAHALDDLSDVSGAAAAADGYLLVKGPTGWTPGSPASVLSNHQHLIEDVQNLQDALDALTAEGQIEDATATAVASGDHFGFRTAAGSYVKATWSSLRAAVVSYFGAGLAASTAKTAPIDADLLVLGDSAASNATKKVTFVEAWTNYFKVKADALYQPVKTILTTLGNLANGEGALLNDGSGALSWGSVGGGVSLVREQTFLSSGNFTPNADATGYEITVVGVGGRGENGNNNSSGEEGSGAGAVRASGSKAEIGNAVIAVTIGAQGNTPNNAGTPTTFGNLVTANSGRRFGDNGNSSPVGGNGSSNLSDFTVYPGGDATSGGGPAPAIPPWGLLGYGKGGDGGADRDSNNESSDGELGGPGIVIVREYIS